MNNQKASFAVKVSIIVPVYNTAEYLCECLDSILNQNVLNIEVICIDDGSTDESLSILYSYAAKDGRVRVLHQDNQTAGSARNRGMDIARGEYLLFLDSDDFFSTKLVETSYGLAKKYDADIAIFGADTFDNVTKKHAAAPWYVKQDLLPIEQPFAASDIPLDILGITTPCPWNKLFKRSFMEHEGLRFQSLPNTNDTYCVISALLLAKRIAYTTEPLVSYRRGMTNNTQSKRNLAPHCFFEALSAIKNLMYERNIYDAYKTAFLEFARDILNYNFKAISFEALPIAERIEMENFFGFSSIYNTDAATECRLKITVAVAVYNTAKYLDKCMDSIVQQTYPNLEIICVNDCSTDNSLDILNKYAARDKRIKIIDKPQNEMTLLARISAVEAATGDYLVFVDSDDYFAPDAMEMVAQAIAAYKTDIVHFSSGLEMVKPDTEYEKYFLKASQPLTGRLVGTDYLKHVFVTRKISTSPWGRAYKMDVIKNAYSMLPRIPARVGEDIFAMFYVALFTRSYVGITTHPLYIYRYGLGISNLDIMSLEKFVMYSAMGELVQWAVDYLGERKCTKLQINALKAMTQRMLDDVMRIFEKERLAPEDIHAAELLVAEHWHGIPCAREVIERKLGVSLSQLMNENHPVPVYTKHSRNYIAEVASPTVSVIIPAFNTSEFLRECIDSVQMQNNGNIEIICINDGSYDDSLAIMEEYYEKYDCVSIISKKNAGLSAARNDGMRLAQGEYILFVDSDDMIGNDCISTLTAIADERLLDFVTFNADVIVDENVELGAAELGMKEMYHRSVYGDDVYTGVDLLCELTKNREYCTPAWLLLLRRSWLFEKNIWFEEGILHEDNPFTFACYLNASRCKHIQLDGYLRRLRNNSIMTSVKSIEHLRGYFTSYLLMAAEARRVGILESEHYEVQYRIRAAFDSAQNIYKQLVNEKRFVPRTSFDFVMRRMMDSALPQCSTVSISSLQKQTSGNITPSVAKPSPSLSYAQVRSNTGTEAYTLSQVPAVPNQTDLNTLTKSGTYLVMHNGKDKVIRNCPTNGTYKLVVDVLTQKVLRQTLIAGNSYNMFVRSYAYGNWTEWINIANRFTQEQKVHIEQGVDMVEKSLLLKLERKIRRMIHPAKKVHKD